MGVGREGVDRRWQMVPLFPSLSTAMIKLNFFLFSLLTC